MKKNFFIRAGTCAAFAIATGILCLPSVWAQGGVPKYEVDTSWPKPLPDRMVVGGLAGACVDARDHVIVLNRQDLLEGDLNAGHLAPPVMEFDPVGNLVNSWGDGKLLNPGLHSCTFDKDNNVWIGSTTVGMLQKYSHDGSKVLLQIGENGHFDSPDGTIKGKFMPASIFVDPKGGDVYIADGEGSINRRVVVTDQNGKFLRQWLPEGMTGVHCLAVSNDGLIYVCNRGGARIQVYDKEGTFIKNIPVAWKPYTTPLDGKIKESGGAVVSLELSRDPKQKFMYVINQNNVEIEVMDRESGKILSSFGSAGHFPGQLDSPHGLAVDSKNNVYVLETRGKRIQRFKSVSQ